MVIAGAARLGARATTSLHARQPRISRSVSLIRYGLALLGLAVALLAAAPSQAQGTAGCGMPPILSDGWQTAAPEQQGLDPKILCGIEQRFASAREANAHAVLVARQGKLVYEHYFGG